jgi:hypothetical protein
MARKGNRQKAIAKAPRRLARKTKGVLDNSLIQGSALRPHIKAGLGAVLGVDRPLIPPVQSQRVSDSIDLDGAMRPTLPNANRWDYLLGILDTGAIVALEPHSATDHEVKVLIAKKREAIIFLALHLNPGSSVARWIWITHGRVGFNRMDRAIRQLDQAGIDFQGKRLKSFG